jgi:competence protein ComEC
MVEIIIWDVQHGSAAYIKSPNGKHIVVDAGLGSYENSDKSFSPLPSMENI